MFNKKSFFFLLSLYFFKAGMVQSNAGEDRLLQKLDSISCSASISKYFAGLYYNTTLNAKDFFASSNEETRNFMQRLETRFGNYFFDAASDYEEFGKASDVWNDYFSGTSFSELQYLLFGINAHINGDIWKALTTEFSLKEIQNHRRDYFSYYEGLKAIYEEVYANAFINERRIRLLHHVSFGLDKLYGRIMLWRWRKRQMRLSILYFTNPKKFERKKKRLHNKMDHINRIIRKKL